MYIIHSNLWLYSRVIKYILHFVLSRGTWPRTKLLVYNHISVFLIGRFFFDLGRSEDAWNTDPWCFEVTSRLRSFQNQSTLECRGSLYYRTIIVDSNTKWRVHVLFQHWDHSHFTVPYGSRHSTEQFQAQKYAQPRLPYGI